MRTSAIIGSIAALLIIAGGVMWFMNTQTDRTRLEQDQANQIEDTAQGPEATMSATQDPVMIEPETTAPSPDEPAEGAQDQTALAEEEPTAAPDEIAEDTIVVEPAADEAAPAATEDPLTADTTPASDAAPATATADANAAEQLLTPDQFDRETYLDLIDASDQLASEDQSRLRALVEGASTNPAMIDGAVNAIRDALDLPPLN